MPYEFGALVGVTPLECRQYHWQR